MLLFIALILALVFHFIN